MDLSDKPFAGDAEMEHGGGCDHMQCHHQCMREGPAVDHSGKLAVGDAADEHGGQCDHIQRHHQRMREGPAVDHSGKLAEGDAAVQRGCQCTYNATISACEKGQQWITAMTLLREMQQWHMKPNVITYSSIISAILFSESSSH